jgi:hypothetical protein
MKEVAGSDAWLELISGTWPLPTLSLLFAHLLLCCVGGVDYLLHPSAALTLLCGAVCCLGICSQTSKGASEKNSSSMLLAERGFVTQVA